MFSQQINYAPHVNTTMPIMPINSLSLPLDMDIMFPSSPIEGYTQPSPLQDITYFVRNAAVHSARSSIVKTEVRRNRERTYQDAEKVQACHNIIEIMSLTGTSLPIEEVLMQLQIFLLSLNADLQTWIETGSLKAVGSDRGRSASEKRRNGQSAIVCLWCASTFTGKHNLANHIRAHLDVHLSFCPNEGCTFSSTNTTLPSRHLAVCPRRPRQGAQLIGPSACSCANAQNFYCF